LLEALPIILKKYPNFILNIYGQGSLEASLKEQAKNLGILDKTIFHGEALKMQDVLLETDLFVLPSVWEGLGIAILEAQAIGVPVIASNVDGIKEIIEDKKNGLLFEPKNPQAIFAAVDSLLSNPELTKQMVEQAYQQVQEKFNLHKIVNEYESLYFELVKNKI